MDKRKSHATPARPEQFKSDVHRDNDVHKGAMEEDRPGPERPRAPGLDKNGMPNDATAIAHDALGANVDKSQG